MIARVVREKKGETGFHFLTGVMGPEAVNVDGARSDNNDDLLCWTDRCKWPGGRFSSSRTLLGGDVGEGDGNDIAADYS